jgi:branched-chain amino acid transport system substrate-binding protein
MRAIFVAIGTMLALSASPALAQGTQGKTIKIGFISSFSGALAALGNEMRNGFELGLDHLDRKMAGIPVEVIYEDDQLKPDVGLQKTQKLIESNKVDFLAGYIWSNVLLPSLKPAVESKTFLITTIAGPSQLAGELCSPYVFSTSWQNNQTPQAMGTYMNQKNVKTLFLIAPNYAGGRDMMSGVKATFKGQIIGEEYTRWPDQLDFSNELTKARAAKPDAIFIFYPGNSGVQFLSQYSQAGLKGQIPLYTVFSIDELTLPLQKDLALGIPGVQVWVNDLPNPVSRRFVADYKKKYNSPPTYYAAYSYDAAAFINSAVVAVGGDLTRKEDIRKQLEKADFASVRGPIKLGNNHIPIQNFYLQEPVKDAEGNYVLKTTATILENDQDLFHDKCPMK